MVNNRDPESQIQNDETLVAEYTALTHSSCDNDKSLKAKVQSKISREKL